MNGQLKFFVKQQVRYLSSRSAFFLWTTYVDFLTEFNYNKCHMSNRLYQRFFFYSFVIKNTGTHYQEIKSSNLTHLLLFD